MHRASNSKRYATASGGTRWARAMALVVLVWLLPTWGYAADTQPARPDPAALLAQAKQATGGAAWDALRTQHSVVRITAGGRPGRAERWASLVTGRSRMHLEVAGSSAWMGYDGINVWSQQGTEKALIETDPVTLRLAANAAYRDRLAFWYPERQAAKIQYGAPTTADGIAYDVIEITPEGGRAYEVWINVTTHRIERLREPEYDQIRMETYSDFRDVQGVKVPFHIQVSRGDPKYDETLVIEATDYNVSLDGIEFTPPVVR